MQGENQNTEKSRITERVRSWEKYGGWTNLKPKGIQTTLGRDCAEYPKADGTDGGESGRLSCQYETGV